MPADQAAPPVRVCMRVNNPYANDPRVHRSATALVRNGYDVTMIADARPELPDTEEKDGVHVVRVGKSSAIPYWSLVRPLRDQGADIYHAHDIDSLFPCLAAARLAGRGARVVYDSHELWSAHAKDKVHFKRGILVRLEGPMVRRADALITASPAFTTVMGHRYGFTKAAVTIDNTPRRYSDEELAPYWAQRDADPTMKVTAVGVFQHGRGAVQLVEALEHLPAQYTVELIGPMPQPDYEKAIRDAAARFGDRVDIAGTVPPDQVVPRLAAAKISAVLFEPISFSYALTSPNKLYESMAAGTPIVASDLLVMGGITYASGAGVVCDPTDPADIARAILAAAGNLDEHRRNARAAAERYNWDVQERKLLALYETLRPAR